MAILHLTLKKEWFDKIADGSKKEEYREVRGYWAKRLKEDADTFKKFDKIVFRNGYRTDSPVMEVEHLGTRLTMWQSERVYALSLGKIISIRR